MTRGERRAGGMAATRVLLCILVASCVSVIHCATDPTDVSALNLLFIDFGSDPALTRWVQNAGDPCGDQWLGVTCQGSSVTAIQLPSLSLSGAVRESVLQQFQHLTVLNLSFNKFDGKIPRLFPPNLIELDLSNNKFTGALPDELINVPSLKIIKLNSNKLEGTLNDQIFTTLVNVEILDLSDNKFSGAIPTSIGDYMVSLKSLYLQKNDFTGQLPRSLSNLTALLICDVSDNELTGYLPPNFNPVTYRYEGNQINQQAPPPPPYTAPPPPKPRTITPIASTKSSSSSLSGSIIGAIVAVILLVLAAAAIAVWFFVIRKRRERTEPETEPGEPSDIEAHHEHNSCCIWCLPLSPARKDYEKPKKAMVFDPDTKGKGMDELKIKAQPPVKTLNIPPAFKDDDPITEKATEKVDKRNISAKAYSVADLQAATNSFSEDNLLGEGSLGRVYRADLPDGQVLAVKKCDTKASMVQKKHDFLNVVEGLAKLQHSSVAELVGYCVEHDQRLLVYKYLGRGTLHELLHASVDNKGLSWNMRVKIALGAGRALEYLHEVCSPPIVHRNFKSANILLDDELNSYVSDCGLEALAPSDAERQLSAQTLGASGYSAPEYSLSGTYTAKSDVYSFGVVMLELLTGRKPFDSSRPRSEQSLVRWATPQLHDIDALTKMVDPALERAYPAKSLSRLADIVALCVQPEPEFRPPISEVVQSVVRLMQRATLSKRRSESEVPVAITPR